MKDYLMGVKDTFLLAGTRNKINPRLWLILEIAVNFILPCLVYRVVSHYHLSLRDALLASAAPPIIWSIWEMLRHRRLDSLSILVLAGVLLSVFVVSLGGSPLFILMRESLITGLFGVFFLLSAILKKPLIYYLARATVIRQGRDKIHRFEASARTQEGKPANWLIIMSMVWGIGLLVEAMLKFWLASNLPIERFLLISPWIGYFIYGILVFWTLQYRKRLLNLAPVGKLTKIGTNEI